MSLLLLAPSADAQSESYPATGDTTMSTVQVTAQPPAFRFRDYQAEDVSVMSYVSADSADRRLAQVIVATRR